MTAILRANDASPGADVSRDCALLWPLLGRHIAFHRRLVDITHSVKGAVLLSQTIYWTRHGRDIALAGGWFHKTAAQWRLETGLTAREQAHARRGLTKLGLIDERRRGVPAQLHFKLITGRLAMLTAALLGRSAGDLDWADGTAIFELLGPPLAYHRSLAAVSGSVPAGLLLSRALYVTRYPARKIQDGWFCTSLKFWSSEIGLGRREQETARRALVCRGLWEEHIRGIPPRLFARVRLNVLHALLVHTPIRSQHLSSQVPVSEDPDGGRPTANTAATPPFSRRDRHHPDSTKPPNQFHPNRLDSCDKSARLNVHSSTGCLVQTPPPPVLPPHRGHDHTAADGQSGGGELVWPESLLPEERIAAKVLVARCPAQAQVLLDELAGRLRNNTVHTSPIAYLRAMVQRALAGDFVPELAASVSAARRRQAEAARARAQRECDLQWLAREQESPAFQAQVATRREQVRQMLEAMRARQKRKVS